MEQIHLTTKEVTPKFFEDFKKGNVVGFKKDNITSHYKIIRMNKSKKTATLTPVKLYTEEEINNMNEEEANRIMYGES